MASLEVAYHYPGRLRVRSAALRTEPEVARAVTERVAAADGVVAHKLSPLTGSLLVEYDAHRIELPALIHAILDAGGFDGVEVDRNVELPAIPSGVRVRGAFDRLGRGVQTMTRGNVDMRTATPGTLVGLGLATFLFGNRRWPEWYDWMFWSFVTFVNLNPPAPVVPRDDAEQSPTGGDVPSS